MPASERRPAPGPYLRGPRRFERCFVPSDGRPAGPPRREAPGAAQRQLRGGGTAGRAPPAWLGRSMREDLSYFTKALPLDALAAQRVSPTEARAPPLLRGNRLSGRGGEGGVI